MIYILLLVLLTSMHYVGDIEYHLASVLPLPQMSIRAQMHISFN